MTAMVGLPSGSRMVVFMRLDCSRTCCRPPWGSPFATSSMSQPAAAGLARVTTLTRPIHATIRQEDISLSPVFYPLAVLTTPAEPRLMELGNEPGLMSIATFKTASPITRIE